MPVDRLAARVAAALARTGGDAVTRVPLLAALSRDTPAFGGTTTASTRDAGPRRKALTTPAVGGTIAPARDGGSLTTPAVGGTTTASARDGGPLTTLAVGGTTAASARDGGPLTSPAVGGTAAPARDGGLRRKALTALVARLRRTAVAPPAPAGQPPEPGEVRPARTAGRADPPRQATREPWPPPLFSMPDAAPARRLPSTTTRRLRTAVHLDPGLAARVVAELTDDPRRAVVPSVGFDLEPVLCHALRARLLVTARDVSLTAVLVAALVLAPRTAAAVLLAGAAVALCRARVVRAAPPAGRALFAAALVFALVAAVGAALTVLAAVAPAGGGFAGPPPGGGGSAAVPPGGWLGVAPGAGWLTAAPGPRMWAGVAVLVAGTVAAHLGHLWWTGAALTAATHPVPRRAATAARVATVAAAQRGNVVFSRADPFVGAGPRMRGWSVAVALRTDDAGGYRPRGPATLDPVLLRRHVGQALQGLGDGAGHAGLPGLSVTPYLAADGIRGAGDPLLDGGTPLPLASREALDAVVRGPQEGLRHYDRVVIVPRARAVTTAEGRPVLPSDDGDGHVSVFVHTAIEASVLYVELSAHVLPPIGTSCAEPPAVAVPVELLTHLTGAPWRLARTAAHRARAAARRRRRGGWHDHSARLGVRELVGDPGAALPALEAAKYVKIVERVVVEAVADFLERYDLDAAAFRAEVPAAR
ncbi:hypothetical protein Daura_34370 [Dactylosporangium aurantiacum]|uniref:Uncharacterized protein n=1 Tax=Dactylosporangium aurantiacum TaxID=35754 RepID=A0A9Q9ID14_9ACTN|nr:hypothetical protein [Dactylosporangium aurantiacum]MDG6107909.1 hypothetical protein [Dactylosporangium aurantiacum]UWZ51787.1 hypothetical protein Daura_34370 [Dactylosporangium aurantiacum]